MGNYGFIIYPNGPSKKYTSKNMMKFWANFAKYGEPGESTNGVNWVPYLDNELQNIMVIDNKKEYENGQNFHYV